MAQNTKTPIMVLQELTAKNNLAPPDYQIAYQISGTHQNRFDYVVNVAGIQGKGCGPSKQIGKHQAALNALLQLRETGLYDPSENPVAAFKVPFVEPSESTSFQHSLNCIVDLQYFCIDKKLPPPEFHQLSSVGPPHNKEFTFSCQIASITTQGKASTKKVAKQLAAKQMIERIKEVIPDIQTEQNNIKNALMEQQAIHRYAEEIHDIIPDKSIKISELPNTLAKLMMNKGLKYEDFSEDLNVPTEESLQKIVERLEIGYTIRQFQESPPMALLNLKIDTPFTLITMGKTYEEARDMVLLETFAMMQEFMRIKLSINVCSTAY